MVSGEAPDRAGQVFHRLRVARVVREGADAVSLVLDVPDELVAAYSYRAGQFVTLRVPVTCPPVRRCYSMSSSPDVDEDLRITVKRVEGGAASNWLNDAVCEGDLLEVSPPAGRFLLTDSQADVVAFAGGSGVTPVLSILKSMLATSGRRSRLFYANRDMESVLFDRELTELEEAYGDRMQISRHLDVESGLATACQVADFAGGTAGGEFYVCGPPPFMDAVETALLGAGTEPDRIHLERFEIEPAPVVPVAPPAEVDVAIELAGRRASGRYRPGTTLLQTARATGLRVPSSCEIGTCGTCMARVVEGAVVMKNDSVLTPQERAAGWVLTCQAIPSSPTVRLLYS